MSFVWPIMLLSLLAAPGLVALYVALVRRRAARTAELAAQGFVPNAAAQRLRRRRHVPFAFFLAGLTVLLGSLARPQMAVSIPRREGTVVLAFDVSNSMRADDLQPTRLAAAKTAAAAFVDKQPSSIKIGVVAFSAGGLITHQPSTDRTAIKAAIKRLSVGGATSLGQGIFASLNAINGKPIATSAKALAEGAQAADGTQGPAIPFLGSSAVILLSDGENTADPKPTDIAKMASTAGVKVFTIGIGSTGGTVVKIDGFSVATKLDESLLTEIAKTTGGTYFHAEDSASLTKVYKSIDLKWKRVSEHTEITGLLTAASALLFTVGAALSLRWFGRVV